MKESVGFFRFISGERKKWGSGMKKYIWILLLWLCCIEAGAENGAGDVAQGFFDALTKGEYVQAASYCADGEMVKRWNPPLITKLFVYDMVQDIAVSQVQATEDEALVTLCVTALDMQSEDVLRDIICEVRDFLAMDVECEESWDYLLEIQQWAKEFVTEYAVPVYAVRQNGVWVVDDAATFDLWRRDAPLTVRAVSYGYITYDEATLAYADAEGEVPPWNIWLRLESEADEEGLGEFSLENGSCAASLESHNDYRAIGYNPIFQRWKKYDGAYHAVLRVADLPQRGTLRALRRFNLMSLTYTEQLVVIDFENVPYDNGVPDGSVRFDVQYYARVSEEDQLLTIGDWLDHFNRWSAWQWRNVTEQMRALPVVNTEYALYVLHGTIQKDAGCFGVYDVLFASDGSGIVPYMEQCDMCTVNAMRYFGREGDWYDFAQMPFVLYVLVPLQEGVDPEKTLRSMQITATFSGELIDYVGAHDSATRLGPRTTVQIDLSRMQRWEGSVMEMPEIEESYHWKWNFDEDDESVEEDSRVWAKIYLNQRVNV